MSDPTAQSAQPTQSAQQRPNQPQQIVPVAVTDVDIPFGQMVNLLVKLALASIPAAIIVWLIFMILGGIAAVVLGGLGAALF